MMTVGHSEKTVDAASEPWAPEVARRGEAWSEPSDPQPRAPPDTVIRDPLSVLPLEPVTRLTGQSVS